MSVRYGVQHVGSGRWLSRWPSLGLGFASTPVEAEAASAETRHQAEQEWKGLHEFKGSWEVRETTVDMIADTPSVELREKRNREQGRDA